MLNINFSNIGGYLQVSIIEIIIQKLVVELIINISIYSVSPSISSGVKVITPPCAPDFSIGTVVSAVVACYDVLAPC